MRLATQLVKVSVVLLHCSEVLGNEAAESWSQIATGNWHFKQSANEKVNVINRVISKCKLIGQICRQAGSIGPWIRLIARLIRHQYVRERVQFGQTTKLTVRVVARETVVTTTLDVEGNQVETIRQIASVKYCNS